MTEEISKAQFAEQLHSVFQAQVGEGLPPYDLELMAVQDYPPTPGIEQFSLFFQGSAALCLPQRIYALAHPVLGDLEIFLVPVGISPDRAYYQYEAAFNRFNKEV